MAYKFVLLCLLISLRCAYLHSQERIDLHEAIKAKGDECFKEVSVSKDLVEKFFKDAVFTDDDNLKCFVKCLHIKMKVMNEHGAYNSEELKKIILPFADDKAKAIEIVETCSNVKGGDACETAFNVAKCFMTE